jgi:hypothetical protein
MVCGGLASGMPVRPTSAYTIAITPASPKSIYLQVGAGLFSPTNGAYVGGLNGTVPGTPANNPTVNKVYVNVPLGSVGNGVAQPMSTDSTVTNSSFDGYTYCAGGGAQLYVGTFYRTTSATPTAAAVLTATVPASLSGANGTSIPFSQISWTSSGNGDTAGNGLLPEVFPGGTFVNGGSQTLGSVQTNRWAESCWTFSYANTAVPAPGIYTGRVIYTLVSP